jgi:hypothetical protein
VPGDHGIDAAHPARIDEGQGGGVRSRAAVQRIGGQRAGYYGGGGRRKRWRRRAASGCSCANSQVRRSAFGLMERSVAPPVARASRAPRRLMNLQGAGLRRGPGSGPRAYPNRAGQGLDRFRHRARTPDTGRPREGLAARTCSPVREVTKFDGAVSPRQ